ncbi:MAG: hypothetical protein IPM95_13365 [Sphingobacteriales bacterium]|nr:hypothetical protein [Sphingobacteriales bacterium]
MIAKVKDNVGGNVLGATTADLFIDATLQSALGQPYARRHWDITPVSSGAAKVTIYIQQSDFNITIRMYIQVLIRCQQVCDIVGMNNLDSDAMPWHFRF